MIMKKYLDIIKVTPNIDYYFQELKLTNNKIIIYR